MAGNGGFGECVPDWRFRVYRSRSQADPERQNRSAACQRGFRSWDNPVLQNDFCPSGERQYRSQSCCVAVSMSGCRSRNVNELDCTISAMAPFGLYSGSRITIRIRRTVAAVEPDLVRSMVLRPFDEEFRIERNAVFGLCVELHHPAVDSIGIQLRIDAAIE